MGGTPDEIIAKERSVIWSVNAARGPDRFAFFFSNSWRGVVCVYFSAYLSTVWVVVGVCRAMGGGDRELNGGRKTDGGVC